MFGNLKSIEFKLPLTMIVSLRLQIQKYLYSYKELITLPNTL